MIDIRPIRPEELLAARTVILSVARQYYAWKESDAEIYARFVRTGVMDDMEDIQEHYFNRQGIFLVALDKDKVIGTGAIRRLEGATCELKRLWLLEAYQGQGIGLRITQQLLDFAKSQHFRLVQLKTSPNQIRAIRFYERLGFHRVNPVDDLQDDYFYELNLD